MPDRNAPCPCGSGKKYKRCCGAASEVPAASTKNRWLMLAGAVAVVAIVGFTPTLFKSKEVASAPAEPVKVVEQTAVPTTAAAADPAAPADPSQPGAAPPGMVWSKEHGHWHRAGATPHTNPIQIDMSNMPNPNATAGPGMVWSEEHKHWHRTKPAATPAAAASAPVGPLGGATAPMAPGVIRVLGQEINTNDPMAMAAAQQGRVWSKEHGHWHTFGGAAVNGEHGAPSGVTPTPQGATPPSAPKH